MFKREYSLVCWQQVNTHTTSEVTRVTAAWQGQQTDVNTERQDLCGTGEMSSVLDDILDDMSEQCELHASLISRHEHLLGQHQQQQWSQARYDVSSYDVDNSSSSTSLSDDKYPVDWSESSQHSSSRGY